ncbi:MAG: FemAB family XrtA/PEP-CTERM system-associated protein [Thiohalomonadales bacterium]
MADNAVQIKYLTDSTHQDWDTYIESKVDSTFFHLSAWRTVLEKGLKHKAHYLYAEKNGKIVGVLPLAQIRSILFGHSLVSTPFCVYGGAVTDDESVSKALIAKATNLANNLKVDYLEVRNKTPVQKDWLIKNLYVTFRKEIDVDSEANMLAIPRKQRAMVRKGIKAGLVSEIEDNIDNFYRAYSESVRNLGTPVFPKQYFKVLFEVFQDKCDILTVKKRSDLVSSVLSFYFRDEVLPYYGGGTSISRMVKGNDFMYWELMRRSGENGIRIFDYGRSKEGTGSYSFKKNWGFQPTPLSYEYYLVKATELPDVNPLNPKYQSFIKIWRKLPLSVANTVGPYIAKNLG